MLILTTNGEHFNLAIEEYSPNHQIKIAAIIIMYAVLIILICGYRVSQCT